MIEFFAPLPDAQPLTLADFCERVDAIPDLDSVDGLLEARPLLQRLAANRALLPDLLASQLLDLNTFQANNSSTGQIFFLHECDKYFIRANVWLPRKWASVAAKENRLFAYDCLHDHNFHLLTVGLHGPGYETDIYAYDPTGLQGARGESAPLSGPVRLRLYEGSSMLMEKSRHVHIQLPASAFSISLNLIPTPSSSNTHPQMIFNLDKGGTVDKYAEGVNSYTCMLMDMIGAMPYGLACQPMLEAVFRRSSSLPIRLYAMRALVRLLGREEALRVLKPTSEQLAQFSQHQPFIEFQESTLFY